MDNKEVIDRLQAYYLTQDPSVVARALASILIDMNRLKHFGELGDKEAQCLEIRLNLMMDELQDFVKNGPRHDMKIIKMNSDEM
jgi:hypothetical protein